MLRSPIKFLPETDGVTFNLTGVWPDNASHKRAIQQSVLQIPGRNKDGKAQTITFDGPASIRYGTRELKLTAKSDSELSVRYFVREDPAEIDGDTLKFGPVSPRTKFPIMVTVVAW